MSNKIHPTAVVAPGAVIGDGNIIGPYSVIGSSVSLGDDNWIGPHVVLGTPAEMRGGPHPEFGMEGVGDVVIGSRNVIHEFTTVQGPSAGITAIRDDCFIMDKVHIAHDNLLEDGVVVAPGVAFAGHVAVGAQSNIGLNVSVHQHCVVGPGSMTGMGAVVTRNVPPFTMVMGSPARPHRWNLPGLERSGVGAEAIERLMNVPVGSFDAIGEDPVLAIALEWYGTRARP